MTAAVRWLAVASRRAETLRVALDQSPLVRQQLHSVVTDRDCPAEDMARQRGVPVHRIPHTGNAAFSSALLEYALEQGVDYLVLFYTRLLEGPLLDQFENRILNIHPSLLPAFRGMRAVPEALGSGARYIGTTFHFIDECVDAGRIVLQSVQPVDPAASEADVRHVQFQQTCRGLVQLCHWLEDDRVRITDGGTRILDARYDSFEFSPALECADALSIECPRTTAVGLS